MGGQPHTDCQIDPESGNVVRFTDNGLKKGDFYPEYQESGDLLLDPSGMPYQLRTEFLANGYAYSLGDGDVE